MQVGSWVCHLTPGFSWRKLFGSLGLGGATSGCSIWTGGAILPGPHPSQPPVPLLALASACFFLTSSQLICFLSPWGPLFLRPLGALLCSAQMRPSQPPSCLGLWGLSHQSLPFLGASFSDSPCCLPGVLLPLHVFLQPLIFLKLADMHGGPSVPERRLFGHRKKCQGRENCGGAGRKGPCGALTMKYGSLWPRFCSEVYKPSVCCPSGCLQDPEVRCQREAWPPSSA